ncbi:MAG: glycerol-3-phosphate 1-O-acyltransferase PlsY [Acetobacteraceae bacterium]|nr:glycerol-3-phosphate 1-O-acyltransferase PlsY [Acetobacteraceae bacterium]
MDRAMIVAAVTGYLLGAIPFGLIVTAMAGIGDIRKIGSGNIGATNVLRTGRKGLAAATLLLDALKGAAAVLIGISLGPLGALVGGLAAVLGHLFPVWLKFKGGKGVATGFGVLISASPLAGLAAGVVWIVMARLVKISSAAALTACAAAPLLIWLIDGRTDRVELAAMIAVLVWIKHHANIRRLLAGTEPRIGQKS